MILSCDKKVNKTYLISYWLAFGQRVNEKLKKTKLVSVLFILSLESLSYSSLYMNISAPNYWILLSVTGDNDITTTSSSSFSAKSAAQVEEKTVKKKIISMPHSKL